MSTTAMYAAGGARVIAEVGSCAVQAEGSEILGRFISLRQISVDLTCLCVLGTAGVSIGDPEQAFQAFFAENVHGA